MLCTARPQDIARMTLAALRSDAAVGKTLTLAGPTAYTTKQVRGCRWLCASTVFGRSSIHANIGQ
jgi:hypothetical protein